MPSFAGRRGNLFSSIRVRHGTVVFCSNVSGNKQTVSLGTGGTGNNYSVVISSITGTANITFIGDSQ
jgi:hypothetical protein